MRFSQSVAALGAFISLASAVPTEELGAFSLDQEDSGRTYIKNGARAVRDAWLRFNGTVPQHIELAAAGASKGSVKTIPAANDREYLTPVNIGTPPRKVMLDIDSGSSDLWVFSTELPAAQRKGHALYLPGKSSSSKKLNGETWAIKYGDGSGASGDVFADKVSVGGVTVTGQAVEAASSVSATFRQDRNNDGIFGFAFSKINNVKPTQQKTWFANAAGHLQKNVFCADLKHGKPGSYDFGFINANKHSGAVHYAPVNRANGFWQFTSGGYAIGGKTIHQSVGYIADTGTSLVMIPKMKILKKYYGKVKTAYYENQVGGYIFACSVTPPSFSILVAGNKRTIPGAFMKYAVAGTVNGKKYCFGGAQYGGFSSNVGILGDVFLKSQYVVFDAANNQVGFANK